VNENPQLEQDLQTYSTLLTLWQAENPIKTIKLQFLLATNAILLGFFQLSGGIISNNYSTSMIGNTADPVFLALGGFALNLIWTLSIGRTSLFQKAWKNKLDDIARRYPDDSRFQILELREAEAQAHAWLRMLGKVSSKYYLLGAPMGFGTAWLFIALLAN
jgi:hypothetical protein